MRGIWGALPRDRRPAAGPAGGRGGSWRRRKAPPRCAIIAPWRALARPASGAGRPLRPRRAGPGASAAGVGPARAARLAGAAQRAHALEAGAAARATGSVPRGLRGVRRRGGARGRSPVRASAARSRTRCGCRRGCGCCRRSLPRPARWPRPGSCSSGIPCSRRRSGISACRFAPRATSAPTPAATSTIGRRGGGASTPPPMPSTSRASFSRTGARCRSPGTGPTAAGAEAAFLREVRDGACRWFRAVLGPEHNAEHRDHFHLDRGLWNACR